jgi:hypothetical protein
MATTILLSIYLRSTYVPSTYKEEYAVLDLLYLMYFT